MSQALKEPEWAQNIIQSAQNMISHNHSDIAWANYIEKIYKLLKSNSFKGAEWIGGKFTIKENGYK